MSALHKLVITDRVISLGVLAAGLGHHVRNALVAVRTFIDLAPEIPVVRCDARISSSGVQTLLTLVRHLLAYAPAPAPGQGART